MRSGFGLVFLFVVGGVMETEVEEVFADLKRAKFRLRVRWRKRSRSSMLDDRINS